MHSIPLIRLGGLLPWVRWLKEQDRPVADWLRAHGLPVAPEKTPLQPVSNYHALAFIAYAAEHEGDDLGCRVVRPDSFLTLDAVGEAIRLSSTPRMAFARAGAAAQYHNSHASYGFSAAPSGNEFQHHALLPLAQLAAHQLHQHVAALILSVCRLTQVPEVDDIRFHIMPHPQHGLEHLEPILGPRICASRSRRVVAQIPDAVLDAPIHWPADIPEIAEGRPPIGGLSCTSLSESARILIAGWLHEGPATLEQLASAAGRSTRSVQRILEAEGTSFRQLHDQVRMNEAKVHLERRATSLGEIANDLGYTYQSSFTRAVRRWMQDPPSKLRKP